MLSQPYLLISDGSSPCAIVSRFQVIHVILIKRLESDSPVVFLLITAVLYFDGFVSREEHLIDIGGTGKHKVQLSLIYESVTFQFGLYSRKRYFLIIETIGSHAQTAGCGVIENVNNFLVVF